MGLRSLADMELTEPFQSASSVRETNKQITGEGKGFGIR